MKQLFLIAYLCICLAGLLTAQTGGGEKYPNLKTNPKSIAEFEDMRFGIFMHWGPSIMRGTSSWGRGNHPYDFAPRVPINEFDSLYLQFNPVLFDAEDWITTVRLSGAKYYVITTKHHDGFSIWDSEYTDYDIMSTPFAHDVLKDLSAECDKQGILFGTYYSICDWHHPDYPGRYGGDPRPVSESSMEEYKTYMYHQLDELVDRYDTDILWFDGSWESPWTHEDGMDLYKYLRDKKDEILVNNRVDKRKTLQDDPKRQLKLAGDYKTPEQEIGEYDNTIPWESCITITNGGWHFDAQRLSKSLREVIHLLVQTAGGGGNLLLNVGPMPDGRIEMVQKQRLLDLGKWLEVYGETIYGTQGGPFEPSKHLATTRKGNKFYVHILDWPEEKIIIPGLDKHNFTIKGFNQQTSVSVEYFADHLELTVPKENRHPINTVVVFELNEEAMNLGDLEPLRFKNLKTATIDPEPAEKFKGKGAESLINKKPGDPSNLYAEWIGYEGVSLTATIDLSTNQKISEIGVGALSNQADWIFTPRHIQIEVSGDGEHFKAIAEQDFALEKVAGISRKELIVKLEESVDAKYIKVHVQNLEVCPDWHKGAGGKAWMLIDEITID